MAAAQSTRGGLMNNDIEYSDSGSPIYRHTPKHEEWTAPASDAEALEHLDRHYAQHFGTGSVFHELVSHLVHLDVHIFEPTAMRNFSVLVTSGMSDQPMQTPPEVADRRYTELLICLPQTWPLSDEAFRDQNHYWPVRWLKTLARLPHEYDTWLGVGHTIPNGDPAEPFAPTTALCGALIA